MLRTISCTARHAAATRTARPRLRLPSCGAASFAPWTRPSGLSRPAGAGWRIPVNQAMYGRRYYSQISDRNSNPSGQDRAQVLPNRQQIIDSIAHHRAPSPYAPQAVDFKKTGARYIDSTQSRIKSLDKLIAEASPLLHKQPARPEGAGNLLTAFDALAAAEKVFLRTGSNTAGGKVEMDGPVGTAVLAYALYQAGKVPIVVADRSNCMLVQEVLEKLDPDC